MAKIVITEIDETLPVSVAESTDIVYVPGFADTNQNCFILTIPNATPVHPDGASTASALVGTTGGSATPKRTDYNTHSTAPQYCINTFDKKAWYYDTEATDDWSDVTAYIDPYPENEPILCGSLSEFVKNFGDAPYQFNKEGSEESVHDRVVTPSFTVGSGTETYELYEEGDYEKSYIYARELIALGVPVLYENFVNRTHTPTETYKKDYPSVTALYGALNTMLDNISDLGEYTVKYITSGAYPTFEIVATSPTTSDTSSQAVGMCKSAATRGDAVALIDHTNKPGRDLTGDNSVYGSVNASGSIFKTAVADGGAKEYAPYATLMTPWAYYSVPNETSAVASIKQAMPASFGYLLSLARSIKTNANWLAVAGVARGVVPNIVALNTTSKLTNSIADSYQLRTGVSINAITNIKPYGLTIWGNRTLLDNETNLTAHSFLNTRNMVNDIKKVAYTVAKSLMFEQNSEQLWLAFKSGIIPTLNQMQSGQGLTGYKILRGTTDEKAKLVATIKLYPIYAVEEFEIEIILKDEEVTVQ
ncbi:MAG: hypothetical protein J6S67_19875 [Methanobrevibacter sp.]|nr:hypothetical protein [Methanobrevibacter sp.]